MTHEVVALAASYMTPEGYGSSTIGRRSWLDGHGNPSEGKELMDISWSSIFASPCSRFGRMSPLTRLGLMTIELLHVGFGDMTEDQRTNLGVCMLSPFGSMATDIEFLRDPGPGTFTYTLPSSVIGEVCIRHRLRGPGLCLMSGGSGGRGIVEEASERIAMGEAESMLCLLCDARGTEAGILLNSALDSIGKFCWYAYGLYLMRKDAARSPGKAVVTGLSPCGADIREMCLDLCGDG